MRSTGNTGNRATPELRAATCAHVQQLLDTTAMSRWAAVKAAAEHIPFSPNAVVRWCDEAGVDRDPESVAVRELQARLEAAKAFTQAVTQQEVNF